MKPGLTNLIFFLLLVPVSCQNTVSPTNDLDQAREWFNGKWNLKAVSSMILNPTVPNVQLIVDNNQIVVIQDGKQTGRVDFEIVETAYNLQLGMCGTRLYKSPEIGYFWMRAWPSMDLDLPLNG